MGRRNRAFFELMYSTGIRRSEALHLKLVDVDFKNQLVSIHQGKGRKDRYAMLSESLLVLLRLWWQEGHARGRLFKTGWLFPGLNPVNPLSSRQLARVCRLAAAEAEIDKPVTMHALRHQANCWQMRPFYLYGLPVNTNNI